MEADAVDGAATANLFARMFFGNEGLFGDKGIFNFGS